MSNGKFAKWLEDISEEWGQLDTLRELPLTKLAWNTATPKWISVEEELPETQYTVLVVFSYLNALRVYPAIYHPLNKIWTDPGCVIILGYITHWMPIQELPKQKSPVVESESDDN